MAKTSMYEMMGRQVKVNLPGKPVEGLVQDVLRDIFEDKYVIMFVGGYSVSLKLPDLIRRDGDKLVLVYGSDGEDEDDSVFWAELKDGAFAGENVDEVLRRTDPGLAKQVVIELGERKLAPRQRVRML